MTSSSNAPLASSGASATKEGPKPDAASGRDLVGLIGLLSALVVLLALAGQLALFWVYFNDDAYITYRYSLFTARGLGPYYNIGEHVEGYTSFLDMILKAGVLLVSGSDLPPLVSKVMGVCFGVGSICLTALVSRDLFDSSDDRRLLVPVLASAILTTSPGFVLNSVSGLETSMLAFFIMLAAWLAQRSARAGRWQGAGVAFALAVLTRPEVPLVFAAFWIASLAMLYPRASQAAAAGKMPGWRSSPALRGLILDGVIVTTVFLAHLLFRYLAYDGELLPNTYYAKAGGYIPESGFGYLWRSYDQLLTVGGLAVGVLGALLLVRDVPFLLSLVAIGVVGYHLPLKTGADWMPGFRMTIPYLPCLAVVVAAGWLTLLQRALRGRRLQLAIATAVLTAGLWIMQDDQRQKDVMLITARARGFQTGHVALANWLRNETKPGDTVALMDIGAVGFLNPDLRVIDISGLTDRHIGKSPGPFLGKEYDPDYIVSNNPRFVVLTFIAPGESYTEPPEGLVFQPMNLIENRIAKDPRFREAYCDPENARPNESWAGFAASLGACRIFEHGFPSKYFLLVVYSRQLQ